MAEELGPASTTALTRAMNWDEIEATLLSLEAPLTTRYRGLFQVRQRAPSPEVAVRLLSKALDVQTKSVLLRHEIAYVLGQLGDASASGVLRGLLRDEAEDEVVRHEAAEALAAIEDAGALEELACFTTEGCRAPEALVHTCALAVAALRRSAETGVAARVCGCQYTSKDPAEGKPGATAEDVPLAAQELADATLPLPQRYQAMFTLRNVGGDAAVAALSAALRADTSSAVLRHEVAFVLGQIESTAAVAALVASLKDPAEHVMVRHEAAIALGSVGSDDAELALRACASDPEPMVSESCDVALSTIEYWRAWEELEARIGAENDEQS
mmetsp:Transcript_103405/g.291955  ORF Transcript_103405/g.291955 Transcript_103405/m.291955 type:complete len:328 (-) Transcript_103405:17-1000(-)